MRLPGNCLVCSGPVGSSTGNPHLCRGCEEDLPWQPPGCVCCGIILKDGDGARDCARCLSAPPAFDSCHALFEYCPPVQDLIGAFKYRQRLAAGEMMAMLLAAAFRRHYEDTTPPLLLIPVPLHTQRLRGRGFNQSLELARRISASSHIPLAAQLCRRTAATPAQRGLTAAKRQQNLRGAFSADCSAGALPAHVAVIDDVVTTTATADELARCLRAAGAGQIDIWALARVNH